MVDCPKCGGQLLTAFDVDTRKQEPSCLQCGWTGPTIDPMVEQARVKELSHGDSRRGFRRPYNQRAQGKKPKKLDLVWCR